MIDTGMGPVFAFCETAIKWTFIYFSIEAKCLDGSTPLHCCVVRTLNKNKAEYYRHLDPHQILPVGVKRLVMADGDEIAEDLVADVGPALEHFLGRRPVLVADLAGAEDMAAAPASFDVFDAFEQLGGFGTAVSLANCGYQAVAVGRDIAPPTATCWFSVWADGSARTSG